MLDQLMLSTSVTHPTIVLIVYSLLLAFVLGVGLAIVYIRSFNGLSYSKNFIHSVILAPTIIAILMQSIGNNLAVGIGMFGAISMIRFRSNIKDPRDMFFLFASVALGVSCGVHAYSIGVIGFLAFTLSVIVLHFSPLSESTTHHGLLRFNLYQNSEVQNAVDQILKNYCTQATLISIRELSQGERLDYAYQVTIRADKTYDSLVKEIKSLDSARGINLMLQSSVVEV